MQLYYFLCFVIAFTHPSAPNCGFYSDTLCHYYLIAITFVGYIKQNSIKSIWHDNQATKTHIYTLICLLWHIVIVKNIINYLKKSLIWSNI
jgi:hypothetical protein